MIYHFHFLVFPGVLEPSVALNHYVFSHEGIKSLRYHQVFNYLIHKTNYSSLVALL